MNIRQGKPTRNLLIQMWLRQKDSTLTESKLKLLTEDGQLSLCKRNSISSTCSRFRHVFSSILWGEIKSSCAARSAFPVKSISSQKGTTWNIFTSRGCAIVTILIITYTCRCSSQLFVCKPLCHNNVLLLSSSYHKNLKRLMNNKLSSIPCTDLFVSCWKKH